jgi:hypothetical protein
VNVCRRGGANHKKTLLLLAAFCAFIAGSASALDQHQHRWLDGIKQYLEDLDSVERDRYQKPIEVIMEPEMLAYERNTVIKELTDVGYTLFREHHFLPKQHFLGFTRSQ